MLRQHTTKCHTGFCEITKNFYVGKEKDLRTLDLKNIDVLVPLHDIREDIWGLGFKGDIMYIPTPDFSVLPRNIEKKYVKRIVKYLKNNKKVAIFCVGGHGRTGYIASLVLYQLGIKDPIAYLRNRYCKKCVESGDQLDAIIYHTRNKRLEIYRDTVINWAWGKNKLDDFNNDGWVLDQELGHINLDGVIDDYLKSLNCDDCRNSNGCSGTEICSEFLSVWE